MDNHYWHPNMLGCYKCGMTVDHYNRYGLTCNAIIEEYLMEDNPSILIKRCECGAETAGFATHVHWCPKGEK